MQVSLALSLLVALVAFSDATLMRRKRFLGTSNWHFVPERLLRIPEHILDLPNGDGSFGPLLKTSSLDSIFGIPNRRISSPERTNDTPKKGGISNVHREMEDPVEEDETRVNAEEVFVDRPTRPEPQPESEKEPDRKIPIFVNSFGLNPFNFGLGLFTPWWKGPNVCVERSEVDESEPEDAESGGFMINFEATQCSPTETTYVCTKKIRNNRIRKTIVMKHQCCHGYQRNDGKPGCSEVSMDDLMETMKSAEAEKFAEICSSTNLAEKLKTENFTIFAPINDAVVDFEDEAENNEIMNARPPKDHSYLVGGHMVEGLINLGSVQNDDVLQSVNGKTAIRINKYRPITQTVTTANCVPVTSKNNMAKNGIVHVTAGVLPLPRKTVADIITASPKLTVFTILLEQNPDLLSELKDSKQSWTVFVPTDKAFEGLDSDMLQKLLTGEGCAESILRNHLLKGTLCSAAVIGRGRVRNSLGKPLTFTQDEVDKLRVEDVKVSSTDILGTNGVVHLIDEVLIPAEAQTILETLKKSDREDLIELIKLAKLEPTFENLQNATFFVPSKDAIKAISNETMEEWKDNPEKLKEILLYHLVAPKTLASNFKNNKELPSFAEDQNVRVQLHEMFPGITMGATAQCSSIVKHDDEVCGAVLHVLDKVMTPPKGTILEALKSMEGQDTITKLLESTDLEQKLASEGAGPYTLLAPNDEAFERFDKDTLQELFDNKTKAEQILRMHILPEALCCSGVSPVFPFRHHYVRTLEGNLLSLHKSSRNERVRFGPARAVHCDTTTKNGIVHTVNRVILPNKRPLTSLFDMDIFGGLFK